MALIDHFAENAGAGAGGNGFERLPSHQFADSLYFWATGVINKAAIISMWNLTESPITDADELQLDEMAAAYTAKSTSLLKLDYMFKMEKIIRLYEIGKVNETQVKAVLEVT